MLWKRTGKRLLRELLPALLQRPDGTIDTDNSISVDHLWDEGEWAQARKQSEKIAWPVLDHNKEATEKTFVMMSTKDTEQNYNHIKQSPNKAFIDFVDRLRVQLERQQERMQVQVMKDVA